MPSPAPTASDTAAPGAEPATGVSTPVIRMPASLYTRLLRQAQDLKASGLLIGDPAHPDLPLPG